MDMLINKNQDSAYLKIDSVDTSQGVLTAWQCAQVIGDQWDDFLASTPLGHFYQTSMWAQVRMLDGWSHLIILITLQDHIIGGFQILIRSKSHLGKIGIVLKGPVVLSDDSAVLHFVISTLKKMAEANKINALIVQPPDGDSKITHFISHSDFSLNHVDYVIKDNTVVVDLHHDEMSIFKAMKHNKRKNINTALRMDVHVRQGNFNDIDVFFRLMVDTCNRQKVKPSPSNIRFLYRMWDLFSRHDNIKLFLAEYENNIVSSLMVVLFGKTAFLWKFGWSGQFSHCRPNDVLYYEIFKWAKLHGFSFADMCAIDTGLADHVSKGKKINQSMLQSYSNFKIGFGGNVVRLTKGFVYIYNPFVRRAYNLFMPFINAVPFLKRKILFTEN